MKKNLRLLKGLKKIKLIINRISVISLLKKIKKTKLIRSVLIISVIFGSFITIGTFINELYKYYYENVAITKNISNKITQISPGQSINYFKEIFGQEITNRNVSNGKKELIFKYKTSYIQTIVDENNSVIFFSVTDCTNPVEIFNSSFINAYSGNQQVFPDKVILNKTTFNNFFRFNDENRKYFISGATANSYYYEYIYVGNPGYYQTFFIGINDICSLKYLGLLSEHNNDNVISDFRKKASITTYGETAPFADDIIISLLKDNKIYLGPDRIMYRVFKN